MRKFLSVPLLLAVVALMAGCEDREPTTLTEPSFAKVEACSTLSDGQNALVGEIEEGIDDLFADRKSARGANQILDNIQRKLCNDQYADATSMAEDFAYLVYRQLPDKLTGPDPEAAAVLLVNMVFELASDPNATPFEIPDGAFEPTGGWGVIDPTSGGTVPCGNGECAVVIDPDAFGGTSPVIIAIERIPDGDVGAPDGPIPGFQGFPQGYEVVSSRQLLPDGPGALMALCVVDWYGSPPERAIGHLMDGGVELLVPVPVDGAVDCANAGDYAGTPLLAEAPGWLQSAARFAGKLARKALGVEPLYARYFAGTGLGGRPGSFTPFVPVAPTIMVGQTVQLTLVNGFEITWASDNGAVATVDGTGLVTGVSAGTATITASWVDDFGVPHDAWIEVTVEAGTDWIVDFEADVIGNPPIAPAGLEFTLQTSAGPILVRSDPHVVPANKIAAFEQEVGTGGVDFLIRPDQYYQETGVIDVSWRAQVQTGFVGGNVNVRDAAFGVVSALAFSGTSVRYKQTEIATYLPGQWHGYTMRIDLDNRTVDYLVDGTLAYHADEFYQTGAVPQVFQIGAEMGGTSAQTFWWDDISVSRVN